MMTIHQAADYIANRLIVAGTPPSLLKLHKLLYYVQAWNLALYNEPMFDEHFSAWVHGPVSRTIYDRFKDTKNMLCQVDRADILNHHNLDEIAIFQIDEVLLAYADFSGTQLENLTRKEFPWLNARQGLERHQFSNNLIDENDIKAFYRSKLT